MFNLQNALTMLVLILLFVCVLLIIRELVTWYWKINTIVKKQDVQEMILLKIHEELVKMNSKYK